mmetsp:Transcript_6297/g.13833  ORF Transcript_6297/g.13833 Transcript_6297/m.13833 type:complete len:446 (-) Transcript_6297:974-2311(-)
MVKIPSIAPMSIVAHSIIDSRNGIEFIAVSIAISPGKISSAIPFNRTSTRRAILTTGTWKGTAVMMRNWRCIAWNDLISHPITSHGITSPDVSHSSVVHHVVVGSFAHTTLTHSIATASVHVIGDSSSHTKITIWRWSVRRMVHIVDIRVKWSTTVMMMERWMAIPIFSTWIPLIRLIWDMRMTAVVRWRLLLVWKLIETTVVFGHGVAVIERRILITIVWMTRMLLWALLVGTALVGMALVGNSWMWSIVLERMTLFLLLQMRIGMIFLKITSLHRMIPILITVAIATAITMLLILCLPVHLFLLHFLLLVQLPLTLDLRPNPPFHILFSLLLSFLLPLLPRTLFVLLRPLLQVLTIRPIECLLLILPSHPGLLLRLLGHRLGFPPPLLGLELVVIPRSISSQVNRPQLRRILRSHRFRMKIPMIQRPRGAEPLLGIQLQQLLQ